MGLKKIGWLCQIVFVLVVFAYAVPTFAGQSAVLLQYHHVDEKTPDSTSVSPQSFAAHVAWLRQNGFSLLPLPNVISTLQNGGAFDNDKVAAITFDDANISVCTKAWPILKKHKIPYTLFISTEAIERKFVSQCSWAQLKEMVTSGLMTPANHGHRHMHMITRPAGTDETQWFAAMKEEIVVAKSLINKHLGTDSGLFAYPYGEYNAKLAKIVKKLGYIGFGQQSGPVGTNSDFTALPRFPISGQHANLETLSTKLLSVPFPAEFIPSIDNPVDIHSRDNPPIITIKPEKILAVESIQCFSADGSRLQQERHNGQLKVLASAPLAKGRHRYTCTSRRPKDGRYYWYSHQWLVEAP